MNSANFFEMFVERSSSSSLDPNRYSSGYSNQGSQKGFVMFNRRSAPEGHLNGFN